MSDADKQLVTDDLLKDVFNLVSKHDIAHLVALGILNNGQTKKQEQSFSQSLSVRYLVTKNQIMS